MVKLVGRLWALLLVFWLFCDFGSVTRFWFEFCLVCVFVTRLSRLALRPGAWSSFSSNTYCY